MNENGVVNIYMIVLSYMFSPNTKIDEEIIIDEDGNVSIHEASSPTRTGGRTSSLDQSIDTNSLRDGHNSNDKGSTEEDQDEQGIEMKETGSF